MIRYPFHDTSGALDAASLVPWAMVIAALLSASSPCPLLGQEDEELEYRPGLIAEYAGRDGTGRARVDAALAFRWNEERPDPRLPAGEFSAKWRGRLFAISRGEYRLHVHLAGAVKVVLKGEVVAEAGRDKAGWVSSRPVQLAYGYHPLEIAYRKTSPAARISLYWSGPKFPLEPVPPRHLFHDPPQTPKRRFAEGQRLVRGLRCASCHDFPGRSTPLPGPALTRLAGNISRTWLVDWIQDAGHGGHDGGVHRMPALGVNRDEAEAVAAFLMAKSEKPPAIRKLRKFPKNKQPSLKHGQELFVTMGCLACHRVGRLGRDTLFGGGDLSRVAQKRPGDFFTRWLADPGDANPDHRMPVFKLDQRERASLALYLATLDGKDDGKRPPVSRRKGKEEDAAVAARGEMLVKQFRCHACHRLPAEGAKSEIDIQRTAVGPNSGWGEGCLGEPHRGKRRPGYRLTKEAAATVRDYVSALHPTLPPRRDGRLVLAEHNCLACHARGHSPGIAEKLPDVIKSHGRLAPLLPAMKPPALIGVGEKFHDKALVEAITTRRESLRPWLKIRMPKFPLSNEELRTLVRHFVESDRIPRPHPQSAGSDASPDSPLRLAAKRVAGGRLVTGAGFGCTSCHAIGAAAPKNVELKSRGPDLAMLGQRVRRAWYDRWMPNPSRIVPRMEMPALVSPIRGVLDEDLNQQLDAVWRVLNERGFRPPQPNPIRVVRATNKPGVTERARVLTDVIEVGEQAYVKPLVVALGNRHNVLFDLEKNQLAHWWLGDAARQRTRGKSWYWEPGGAELLPEWESSAGDSEVVLIRGGKRIQPLLAGQFPTEFDWLEHAGHGLRFGQRLRFPARGGKSKSFTLRVIQSIQPLSTKRSSGFHRRVEIAGLPPGESLRLRLLPPGAGQSKIFSVQVADAAARRWDRDSSSVSFTAAKDGQPLVCEANYLTRLPADRYLQAVPKIPAPPAVKLDVAPGFEAVRLPLDDGLMPTALAWRKDGALAVASLKGRVWLARDSDGDGLEDKLSPFSEELAAPYGLAAHGDAVDVLNKYALLRLHDDDGDGRADRTVTLASGWGHTRDYHDWAVGLEKDAHGNYYMALPCQQDDRSGAAAHLRGKALRLTPRQPTTEDPGTYGKEILCAGLRFPMGLALDREGELFATDNQGNYNPFNELNHLQSGRRYGFINKLEFRPDFNPKLTPPAIDLPHPWTRSVNGIAFLYTPPAVREKLGRDAFGPFEGHMIGCEYNERSLIRMSLEKVGGEFQGAAYPFTVDPPSGSKPMQGPVVCEVSPRGDLYVGNMRDSAWGGGASTGSIVRLRPTGDWPAGIAEVRAAPRGFTIDFTAPVDAKLAAQSGSYAVSSYRRVSTPDYGGKDQDRKTHKILAVELSQDRRRAMITVDEMRAGFLYELRLKDVASGAPFLPAEAYYTLRRVPQ